MEVEGAVLELLGEVLGDGSSRRVGPGTDLSEVGFDSLAYAELAAGVEERLGVSLPDDPVRDLATASDLVELVRRYAGPGPGRSTEARADLVAPLTQLPPGVGRLQRPVRLVARPVFRRWFGLAVEHPELMPAEGPVILCMNHESWLDIPLAVIASPRPVTFMAKQELFRSRVGGPLLRRLGGFRVDREAFDLGAVRASLAILSAGGVLGIYPEGTRSPGQLLPFLNGAAWLALRTGAPLVPMAMRGTERATPPGAKVPKRVPVAVVFDPPIEVERVEDPVRRRTEAVLVTARLRAAFERLLG
ncbi:MAG: 1-acyl-sn-glycerol-3-phosphate acyltransferase [Actinobacteria bacterium]|nr:1-acyl-sn-glycerol-3-phosphate acyltransferase [Actinomycetota bacterium]